MDLKKTLSAGSTFILMAFAHGQDITPEENPFAAKNGSQKETSALLEPVSKENLSRNTIRATGYYADGSLRYRIHLKNEKLHGSWQTFYSNGRPCDSGRLENGIPHGQWKTWNAEGKLSTLRTYHAEKYHYVKADLQRSHPRYSRYSLTHHALKGRDVSAHFRPQYGPGTTFPNAMQWAELIRKNTDTSAALYLPPFTASLHHGWFVNFNDQEGIKDAGHYENGLKQGLWQETDPITGIRAQGEYRNGLRRGQWKYYHANNQLLYSEQYQQGGELKHRHHFRQRPHP